jgi:hypothetical protein
MGFVDLGRTRGGGGTRVLEGVVLRDGGVPEDGVVDWGVGEVLDDATTGARGG